MLCEKILSLYEDSGKEFPEVNETKSLTVIRGQSLGLGKRVGVKSCSDYWRGFFC